MYSWTLITGDTPQSVDATRLRQSLGAFATGVCLVTTVTEAGKREGMTVNSFSSVSLTPPLVLWSVRDDARSADAFIAARHFVIHVLSAGQKELALHFARPAADKFAAWEDAFAPGLGGCPRLREAAAVFECTTWSRHGEGDHTILVGRVDAFDTTPAEPLLFHAGQIRTAPELAQALGRPSP
ncbi:MAG TPA: flavin reductase family protein [Ramlibacter sp.]|jgi:flavin reductase (DIM6/NTAB) family NADH-FMN oxidoreductase RutF|nr:flavin reductase family protein [Ramlibacter sp.]